MQRTIITPSDVAPLTAGPSGEGGGPTSSGRPSPKDTEADPYLSRLLKYIPAEVVAVYLTLEGIVKASQAILPEQRFLWGIFLFCLVATPIYLYKVMHVWRRGQLIVSTLAFGVWVFAIGGPFDFITWRPPVGSLAIVVFTFLVPLLG